MIPQEHEVGTESCVEQKSLYSSLHQELETKSRELEATTKSLSDLKVHYDMFSELRNKEVDTLNSNCEQAKRVIKDFEEKATSLRDELQRLKDSKGQDGVDLKKQIDGISGINDVLRRTLNEKIEELNQAKDKVSVTYLSACIINFMVKWLSISLQPLIHPCLNIQLNFMGV